ncbi:ORF10 [Agrotis segetum granulovirus]|uniref:ORF10 n=1 Tax=Agrotis segetum granulosis virus TaxID=10464 RepID=Q6QXC9_GVAS|nr:hypothetical protein AsGV011 [Agrotis segetum granulovirus]AAS82728.1 ORF10 [Agrotis segetum granulovirus]AHN92050.1 hypothetical protein AsGV011 [Agrotis segetum granulovirus]AKN63285.1 hypothetical protein AsGV011 [Agrotis segetum granulovirus]
MDVLSFPTLIFLILVILKIYIFHGYKMLQRKDWFMNNICIDGYYGFAADPFECDVYYKCPEKIRFYCDVGTQYDADKSVCVPNDEVNGCYEIMRRRLLI